jgi:hypothetical protein
LPLRFSASMQTLVAIWYSQRPQQLLSLEPRQRAPRSQQGLLECVVGVEHRPEHAVAVGVYCCAVGLDDEAKSLLVPVAGRVQSPGLRRTIPSHMPEATPAYDGPEWTPSKVRR